MIRVPHYNDDVRAALASEGIVETFAATNPEPDSMVSTDMRVTVPVVDGDVYPVESQADAALMHALHPLSVERRSSFHYLHPSEFE